jgi:mannose-6-phosphate isomerase class I
MSCEHSLAETQRNAEKIELKKGRTAWIPANYGEVKLVGEMQLLKIRC